jgi:hypothetical protein
MADSNDTTTRKVRRAGAVGLVLQLAAAFYWTPATFILSAAVGVPLVLAGGLMFFAAVWKTMKDKGAV